MSFNQFKKLKKIKQLNKNIFSDYNNNLKKFLNELTNYFNFNIALYHNSNTPLLWYYELSKSLSNSIEESYMFHTYSYCLYVKSFKINNRRCYINRRTAIRKVIKNRKIYYGKCFLGVEEFLFPIIHNNKVVAVGCLGPFCNNLNESLIFIENQAKKYQINDQKLKKIYKDNITLLQNRHFQEVSTVISLLSNYISLMYKKYESEEKMKSEVQKKNENSIKEDYDLIKRAIEYINHHYNEKLCLDSISEAVHCNPSYISRLFSEKMEINLTQFINKIRIKNSKKLLKKTNYNISTISLYVGFNDPNYFSTVFKNFEGITPTEYRKH